MNRKEFVAANGAVDTIRDVWQQTEAASGSAFNDRLLGDNVVKLLTTKNELDNVNLITGLQGFFAPGLVSFEGGNILLGGGGSDAIIGGGGNDILEGDAWLHVGLTSYTAGASIIRQINYDANGNTYDPGTANFDVRMQTGWSSRVPSHLELGTSTPPMSTPRSITTSCPTTTLPCSDRTPKASSRFSTISSPPVAVVAVVVAVAGGRWSLMTAPTGCATSSGSSSLTGQLPSTRTAT